MCFQRGNRKISLKVDVMPNALLDVQELEVTFKTPEGNIHAVNGASFGLKEGETLGVVG
jgi:ABC-type glutathione transport system ATPase component